MKKESEQNTLEGRTIKATKPLLLDDGLHIGIITDMQYREDENHGYEYVDIFLETVINEKGGDRIIELRTSFPYSLSDNTLFGRFLHEMTFGYKEENEYSLQEIKDFIVNKKIKFQTVQQETPKGTFSNILRETIKLK